MAIHIKKKNVGKFTAYKKRTGKTTAEALHSKDPHVRQMANFARNAKKWHHEFGGIVEGYNPMFGNGGLSPEKAKLILADGTVRGHKITDKQRRYFGMIAGGGTPIKHPLGGVVNPDGPTFGDPNSASVVTNNLWTPQTRVSIYPYLAQRGLLGHGADSLTMQQWNRLTPEQTIPYMQNEGFDYTRGNTANPGGIKYWQVDKVPAINGKSIRPSRFSEKYWREKANTQYGIGGTLQGIGSIASMIPGAGTIFGGALNMIGGQISQDEQAKQLFLQQQQAGAMAANANQAGIVNQYMPTFPNGGIAPDGTPLEVERGEVMRDPGDGSLAKVSDSAPTHAQGGVDTSAEPGTQIYGKMKVKSGRFKGLTYKEAADRIKKQLAQLDKD